MRTSKKKAKQPARARLRHRRGSGLLDGRFTIDHGELHQLYVEAYGRARLTIAASAPLPSFEWEVLHPPETVAITMGIADAAQTAPLKSQMQLNRAMWAVFDHPLDRKQLRPLSDQVLHFLNGGPFVEERPHSEPCECVACQGWVARTASPASA